MVADGSGGNNVFNACGFVVAKVNLGLDTIVDDEVGAQALDGGALLTLSNGSVGFYTIDVVFADGLRAVDAYQGVSVVAHLCGGFVVDGHSTEGWVDNVGFGGHHQIGSARKNVGGIFHIHSGAINLVKLFHLGTSQRAVFYLKAEGHTEGVPDVCLKGAGERYVANGVVGSLYFAGVVILSLKGYSFMCGYAGKACQHRVCSIGVQCPGGA